MNVHYAKFQKTFDSRMGKNLQLSGTVFPLDFTFLDSTFDKGPITEVENEHFKLLDVRLNEMS